MRYLLPTFGALLLAAAPVLADGPGPSGKEPAQAEKIYQLLKERKDLEIKNQPLPKALETLSELLGITFEADPSLLQEIPGLAVPSPFTVTMRGSKVPVGGALNRALAPHGFTYVVLVDRVFVTTTDRAVPMQMQQKVTGSIENQPLAKALDEIARYYGVSILLDPQAGKLGETKISVGRIQGASLEALVHVLASGAGMQAVRLDNVLYVTTAEKAKLLPKKLVPVPPAPPSVPMGLFGMQGAVGGQIGFGGAAGIAGNFGMGGAFGVIGGPAPQPPPKKNDDPKKSSSLPQRFDVYRLVMAAPLPEKGKAPADETPAQRLRRELNTPVTIELVGLALPQAINQLKEKTGVDFALDRAVLDMYFAERMAAAGGMGNTDNVNVTARMNKVPLRRGLRNLLSEYDLGFVIIGEQVLITTQTMSFVRVLRQPISMDVDKVPLADALKKLARDTGANLILDGKAGKEAQEKVSLQVDDVPLETAVKLLADQAGLRTVIVDNVLIVTSKTKAAEMREDPDFRPRGENPDGGKVDVPKGFPGGMGGGVPPMVVPPMPGGAAPPGGVKNEPAPRPIN